MRGSVSNRLAHHQSEQPHVFTIAEGDPVRLAGESQMSLAVTFHYRVVEDDAPDKEPFRVRTAGYFFDFYDPDRQRPIGYHWHPYDPKSPFKTPHLHLGKRFRSEQLHHKAHLPTGRVSLEEVMRFAVSCLGVQPIRGDWDAVLQRTYERHAANRSWGTVAPLKP